MVCRRHPALASPTSWRWGWGAGNAGGQALHSLFLLLKADTARAGSMSLSLISSLCLPLLQKSKATSVILSAPALLQRKGRERGLGFSPKPRGSGSERVRRAPAPNVPEKYEDGFLIGDPVQVVVIV